MEKEKNNIEIGIGYIAEACRLTGISRTTFETARRRKAAGEVLTRREIEVLAKHRELIEDAERKVNSIYNNVC
jgi:gamma-glutamylcysteine synthetase